MTFAAFAATRLTRSDKASRNRGAACSGEMSRSAPTASISASTLRFAIETILEYKGRNYEANGQRAVEGRSENRQRQHLDGQRSVRQDAIFVQYSFRGREGNQSGRVA